jgi:hypothetical protein
MTVSNDIIDLWQTDTPFRILDHGRLRHTYPSSAGGYLPSTGHQSPKNFLVTQMAPWSGRKVSTCVNTAQTHNGDHCGCGHSSPISPVSTDTSTLVLYSDGDLTVTESSYNPEM